MSNDAIKSGADLRGKKIGVSSPSALTGWLGLEFARAQNWPRDGITLVTVGGSVPTQTAALLTGEVDAIVSDIAVGYDLESRGKGRLLMPSSAYVKDFVTNATFATTGLAKDHPDTLRHFLAAYYAAASFAHAHKAETVSAAVKLSGQPPNVVARQYDDTISMFSTDGHITPAQLANVARAVVDVGMMQTRPDFAPYYDPQFLPAGP